MRRSPLTGRVTYFDLLRARQGDFTNSVALFDYLDRLPPEQSRLARRLLAQDTLEEARSALGWDTPQLCRVLEQLQAELTRYLTE